MVSSAGNPFKQDVMPKVLQCVTDVETAGALELLAEDLASSTARVMVEGGMEFTAVFPAEVEEELLERIARLARVSGKDIAPSIVPLEETNWEEKIIHDFPPLSIGRFYVAGSHLQQEAPVASVPLVIDASAAFGTGEHGTTEGCLRAIEALCKQRDFFRMMDMGCGTAILALGMFALTKRKVMAIDNDPVAVRVAREHVRMNKAVRFIRCDVGNGYKHRPARGRAPYDLLVANILARPLMRMAHEAAQHLAPNGVMVLSGLLNEQEPMVLAAHRAQGLYLRKRLRVGKWSILVLAR